MQFFQKNKTIKILCFEKNPDSIIKIIEELENSSSYSLIKKIAKSSLGITNKGASKESVRQNLNSKYIEKKQIIRINNGTNIISRINNGNNNITYYKKYYNYLEKLSNLCIEYEENVQNINKTKINLPLYEISNNLNKIIFDSIESYLKELDNLDNSNKSKYKKNIDPVKIKIKENFMKFINTEYNLKLNKNDILEKFKLLGNKNENTIKKIFLKQLKEYNINYILILKFDKKGLKNTKLIQEGGELVTLLFIILVILVLIICVYAGPLACFGAVVASGI
jgi:hypothetical protein